MRDCVFKYTVFIITLSLLLLEADVIQQINTFPSVQLQGSITLLASLIHFIIVLLSLLSLLIGKSPKVEIQVFYLPPKVNLAVHYNRYLRY